MPVTDVQMSTRRSAFAVLPAERAFRAMGTDAHVVVWQDRASPAAPEELLDLAEREVARLERLWSRFIPTSDVCRVNAANGGAVTVAPETLELLDVANRAAVWSGHRFDPALLHAIEAAGYDESFDELRDRAVVRPSVRVSASPPAAWAPISIDRERSTAAAPHGRGIDLGGIGKGRTADLVAGLLLQHGASGACVNIGGDLRVVGETGDVDGILVAVDDPVHGGAPLTMISVRNIAVATTARTRRCWTTPDGPMHHVIDPATRRPADGDVASVTVIASTAAWAEVAAKVAFLSPRSSEPEIGGDGSEHPALLVGVDGSLRRVGGFEEFER